MSSAQVAYGYAAESDKELSCKEGEVLTVITQKGDWWYCENGDGEKGYVPCGFLSQVDSQANSTAESPVSEAGDLCAGCSQSLGDKKVTALDQVWHPNCFTCDDCKKPLVLDSFHMVGKDSKRKVCQYCKNRERCYRCDIIIVSSSMELDGKIYHKNCLSCKKCGIQLKSVIQRGDDFYCKACATGKIDKGTGAAAAIAPITNYCRACKKELDKTQETIRACNGQWHVACFVCQDCKKPFPNDVFNNKDGYPYCDACIEKQRKNRGNYRKLASTAPPSRSNRRKGKGLVTGPRRYVTGGYTPKKSDAWNDMGDDL